MFRVKMRRRRVLRYQQFSVPILTKFEDKIYPLFVVKNGTAISMSEKYSFLVTYFYNDHF